MKQVILTFLCWLISSTFVLAQNDITKEEFETYSANQQKLVSDAFAKKDYQQIEKLLLDFIGTYDKLLPEAKELYKQIQSGNYYNMACLYSLKKDKKQAVNYFGKAVNAGYTNYLHAQKDTDLDFIRNDEKFRTLMEGLREKGDYFHILKKAGEYNTAEKRDLPNFIYQSPNDEELIRVRKHFNLDSIAEQGDEISRIKNLLKWAHNVVRHDGSSINPEPRNSINIVEVCRKENRGVNCRMLAILLNECYLTMGFKSRFVTCLSKSFEDGECHVINTVYSNTLGKWLWMDPTFNAYLTDENGLLLSIAEVREKLIKGETIVLNADANWNNQNPQTKEAYLDAYMSKNLYWFDCPLISEYNFESPDSNKPPYKYVRLYPVGYERKEDNKRNEKIITYITNNPDYFWQKPE